MTYLVQQTSAFAEWHSSLKDMHGKIAIARRIERAARGNLGDVKALGDGLSELRVDVGPGYRLYFVKRGEVVSLPVAIKSPSKRIFAGPESWRRRLDHEQSSAN